VTTSQSGFGIDARAVHDHSPISIESSGNITVDAFTAFGIFSRAYDIPISSVNGGDFAKPQGAVPMGLGHHCRKRSAQHREQRQLHGNRLY
jgi:hypothetical protein